MDNWEMARLGLRAVRTMARLAEQQQRMRERELKQSPNQDPAHSRASSRAATSNQGARPIRPAQNGPDDAEASTPACRPEFAMPVNTEGEIPDEFLPKI